MFGLKCGGYHKATIFLYILCSSTFLFHLIEEWINNGGEPDWALLSMNPNAIKILEKNKDKIVWGKLSLNPSIFELDRKRMVEELS